MFKLGCKFNTWGCGPLLTPTGVSFNTPVFYSVSIKTTPSNFGVNPDLNIKDLGRAADDFDGWKRVEYHYFKKIKWNNFNFKKVSSSSPTGFLAQVGIWGHAARNGSQNQSSAI